MICEGTNSSLALKSLSRQDAGMVLAVRRFVCDELGVDISGRRLLIALSGGADSTALLVIFCALRSVLDVEIASAHLDHGLRAESEEEARMAGELCGRFGVEFFQRREDVGSLAEKWHCGLEEAGRKARYAFLEECRARTGSRWVLTAHHVGDLAEDILMRLSRGASWPGLGGMRAVVDEPERHILRPLLMQQKKDLEAMLKRLGIAWAEDASNQSRQWKRNRMRHDVVPLFLGENPSFYENVGRIWRAARREERYWQERTAALLQDTEKGIFIPAQALEELEEAGRMHAMAEALRQMGGIARADTLEAMEKTWQGRMFPRRFSFGGAVKAELSGKGMLFFRMAGR